MTKQYNGNGNYDVIFSDGSVINMNESQIKEIVESNGVKLEQLMSKLNDIRITLDEAIWSISEILDADE